MPHSSQIKNTTPIYIKMTYHCVAMEFLQEKRTDGLNAENSLDLCCKEKQQKGSAEGYMYFKKCLYSLYSCLLLHVFYIYNPKNKEGEHLMLVRKRIISVTENRIWCTKGE